MQGWLGDFGAEWVRSLVRSMGIIGLCLASC